MRFLTMAMSVVVPPMSTTRALGASDRVQAPMTLAAGPHRSVSTGRSDAKVSDIWDPSLRMIVIGTSS